MNTRRIIGQPVLLAAVTLAGAILVALAACGVATPNTATTARPVAPTGASPSLSGAPTTPASPADQAKQTALAAYRDMWHDFVIAGTTSDWQSPALGQYATGVALTNMSRALYADHYNGLVTKGEPALSPSVSSVAPPDNPTKIIISDCGDSTHWLKYHASNGQLADKTPGGRQSINAVVEKQDDGSWKVTDYGVHDVGTC